MPARTAIAAALFFPQILTVADTPTRARTPTGEFISWREHRIDDQALSGVPIRGADGLQLADFDRDGHLDIVSVHEDSNHVRIAFGSPNPGKWQLATLADGDEAAAAEDAAVGDLNGDGYPDIIVACELAHLIYFQNPRKSARTAKWPRRIVPNTQNRGSWIRVFLADLNSDGRLEAIAPNKARMYWLENIRKKPLEFRKHLVRIEGLADTAPGPWAFMVDFADLNGDGRKDMVMGGGKSTIIWLEQPPTLDGVWKRHTIGHTFPDNPTAMTLTDLNGDGRPDLVTGGYSQNPRDHDGEKITAESIVGRITWFENRGATWIRHDISRTKRGMYDAFVPRDMDGDGDLDLIGTRGNSGEFDGVFWLEQLRTNQPRKAFQPARARESTHLPLPAADR